ncbi:MAG: hypothetical protein COA78_38200 [Blastopirellula sp.]|nr:MAG: hypothetical protein COA78_38200 [Blastopirellula sp.]
MIRNIKLTLTICLVTVVSIIAGTALAETANDHDKARLSKLNKYWAEVSRAVNEGDFAAYKATCHEEGVLVSGVRKTSQPLSEALARWEKGFTATKSGKVQARVEFRFSQRLGDSKTSHETGIFRYSTVDLEGIRQDEYIHFEGLLVNKDGKWKILMEYQKSIATREQWQALK